MELYFNNILAIKYENISAIHVYGDYIAYSYYPAEITEEEEKELSALMIVLISLLIVVVVVNIIIVVVCCFKNKN